MDGSNINVTGEELRQFVERVEQVRAEQAYLKAVEKEIFAEMKGRGYMTRPIRSIIKERAENPDDRAEAAAVLELYRSALGMA